MNNTVDDLVLAPFRDVVAQGKAAINNAENSGDDEMLRAAQVLVKEGERALKKMEPACQKGYDEYGQNFVDALMDNGISRLSPLSNSTHKADYLVGPISELTEELSGFLYDFEDYVEADKFDARRFSELQALLRRAAPRMLHVITRMKLTPPQCPDSVTYPVTEDVPPYPESPLPLPYPEGPEADGQIHDALRHVAKLDKALEETPTEAFAMLPYPVEEYESRPGIPDPWPRNFLMPKEGPHRTSQRLETTVSSASSASVSDYHPGRNLYPNSGQMSVSFPAIPPRSPARRSNTYYSNEQLVPPPDFASAPAIYRGKENISGASSSIYTRASIGSSTLISRQSSISDRRRGRESYSDIVSPLPAVDRDSVSSEKSGQSLQVKPLFARSTIGYSSFPVDKSLKVPAIPVQDVPDGLMPVDNEPTEQAPPLRPPPPIPEDRSITLDSSFYHFKGFCQGSMEMIQGGLGFRRIKKQVSPVPSRGAARPRAH